MLSWLVYRAIRGCTQRTLKKTSRSSERLPRSTATHRYQKSSRNFFLTWGKNIYRHSFHADVKVNLVGKISALFVIDAHGASLMCEGVSSCFEMLFGEHFSFFFFCDPSPFISTGFSEIVTVGI